MSKIQFTLDGFNAGLGASFVSIASRCPGYSNCPDQRTACFTMTPMPEENAKKIVELLDGRATRGALLAVMVDTCRLTPELVAERAADLADIARANVRAFKLN